MAVDLKSPEAAGSTRSGDPLPSSSSSSAALGEVTAERDFYYQKLRDLEVFVDHACETSGGGEHTALAAHQIRAILYATNDVFAPPP